MLCNGQWRLICGSGSLTQTWMTEGKSHLNVYEKRFQASETSEIASHSPWVGKCLIIQKSRQEDLCGRNGLQRGVAQDKVRNKVRGWIMWNPVGHGKITGLCSTCDGKSRGVMWPNSYNERLMCRQLTVESKAKERVLQAYNYSL